MRPTPSTGPAGGSHTWLVPVNQRRSRRQSRDWRSRMKSQALALTAASMLGSADARSWGACSRAVDSEDI